MDFTGQLPRAQQLQAWYQREGQNMQPVQTSRGASNVSGPRLTLQQLVNDSSDATNMNNSLVARVQVMHIPHERKVWYEACGHQLEGGKVCQKKAVENPGGQWSCADGHFVAAPNPRYIFGMKVVDTTTSQDVKVFEDVGKAMLGRPASDLYTMDQMSPEYDRVFDQALFTFWVVKVRTKMTTFREEQQLERTITDCKRMNFKEEAGLCLKDLREMFPW
jgi:replication factor A1